MNLFWGLEDVAALVEKLKLNHYRTLVALYEQQIELKTAHDLDY